MLALLHIENIAVIEKADIEFTPGFNAMTGETGAGKSIVVDSISAVLGGRVSRGLIRTGAQRALISATFCDVEPSEWLSGNLVEPEDGELIVQREISVLGKSVCRVNGRPCPVSFLRELGQRLINLHGQHDSQQLFDEQSHLEWLDSFAGDTELLKEYRAEYDALAALRRRIGSLTMDEDEKKRKSERLSRCVDELEALGYVPGEEKELIRRRDVLRSGAKVAESVSLALRAVRGGDDGGGACAEIETALSAIEDIKEFGFSELAELLLELKYQAEEAAQRLMELSGEEYSPDELERIEERLDALHRAAGRYKVTESELAALLEESRRELEGLRGADDELRALKKKYQAQKKSCAAAAARLTEARKKAAAELKLKMEDELSQLSMPGARFEVEFAAAGRRLTPGGADSIRFMLSANAGEELRPLSKIASGGELSRIMLAMKNVLTEGDGVPTLIFDEVDAGVSGRAAQRVGEKLLQLSRTKQVLCVTHLPQIAAQANTHFCIEKNELDGRTHTSVSRLDEEGRKQELARLIGGASITETTLRSAGEMLTGKVI